MESTTKKPMTHWKKLTNPNYLGTYALNPGEEKILTIKSVGPEKVMGSDGSSQECIVAHFTEQEKPMILNKTNCKVIEKLYKTPYTEEWAGKKIRIYSAKVKAFGDTVDALRIRQVIPQTKKPALDAERFAKMIDKIKSNEYTVENARKSFNLTQAQNEQLNAISQ